MFVHAKHVFGRGKYHVCVWPNFTFLFILKYSIAKNLKTTRGLKLNVAQLAYWAVLHDGWCGNSSETNRRRQSAEVGRRGAEIPVCVWRGVSCRVGEISQQVDSTYEIWGIEVKRPSLPSSIKVLILIQIADLLPDLRVNRPPSQWTKTWPSESRFRCKFTK